MAVQTEPDPDTESYECDLCGQTFGSEAALRAHVRAVGIVD